MEHARLRKPSSAQLEHASPRDPTLLAPAAKSAPPQSQQSVPERREANEVSWHRVVVEVALHDRIEPSTRLGHGIAHTPVELLLDHSQFGPHALADRRSSHGESPDPVFPTNITMRVWNRSHHGSWHLYGHSHGRLPEPPTLLSMDVGVDTHDFRPWH
jgi:hypothetical protein